MHGSSLLVLDQEMTPKLILKEAGRGFKKGFKEDLNGGFEGGSLKLQGGRKRVSIHHYHLCSTCVLKFIPLRFTIQ